MGEAWFRTVKAWTESATRCKILISAVVSLVELAGGDYWDLVDRNIFFFCACMGCFLFSFGLVEIDDESLMALQST